MPAGKLVWPSAAAIAAVLLWESGLAGRRPPAPAEEAAAALEPSAMVRAEGRLAGYPGSEVVVGCELGGTIVVMPVGEKSAVSKGDLIAEFRADDLKASRAEAAARGAEMEAEIRFHQGELRRAELLHSRSVASPSELETHRRNLDTARARLAAAVASVSHLDAMLRKTRVLAPIDGVVVARHAHPGETVPAGARLVTVADLRKVRVEAEVDEYDIGRVALGDPATVTAEGFPGSSWRGRVEEIPDVVVPRRIRPEDPGRPTDTRVLVVKIALVGPTPLKLGQRVEVQVAPAR